MRLLRTKVAVTSNSLAKRSSFRESSFVLTQTNYQKLQRTGKRKWNKRIFLISNLPTLIHFLLSLLVSHENEVLILWIAANNMTPQQKLLFFYVKNTSVSKKKHQAFMTLLINQILLSFEMRKYADFTKSNMILMAIAKAQLLPFDSWNMSFPSSKFWNSYLKKNFTFRFSIYLQVCQKFNSKYFLHRYIFSCKSFYQLLNFAVDRTS